MKIFTLGKGFISDHLPYSKIEDRINLDWQHINQLLDNYQPNILINCIGTTGRPNIDYCESHQNETATNNVAIPIMLAEACAKKKIKLIHIGSGCIYFGQSPHLIDDPDKKHNLIIGEKPQIDSGWKEEDFANPLSYYSNTKYACDLVLGQMPNVLTLRIRMPISEQNHHRNLLNKLRGYQNIIDIPNSMTFVKDFVRCVDFSIINDLNGIFHCVNSQPLTAAQIMKEYQKYITSHSFKIMTEAELDRVTIAKRSNCILSNAKLKLAGFKLTNSQEALEECMIQYIKNIGRDNVE